MRVLLDTCGIIWAVSAPKELSKEVRSLVENPETEIFYSPMSCAEVAWGVQRKRILRDRHWKLWFRYYVELNDWRCVPMDLAIVEEAYSLPEPFHSDPVDRLIVATARLHGLQVVTADRKMLQYPHVQTVW
jgi:PIN domain nuclease of toxin-antitoxin system